MYGKAEIPLILWIATIISVILTFLVSPNILIMIPLAVYIPFIYKLFFIKGNPNVIFWGLVYQWLSVSTQTIYATISGVSLNDLFIGTIFPSELMEYTAFLSITGQFIFAAGVYLAVKKLRVSIPENVWDRYDPQKILYTYIGVSIIININQAIIWAFPNIVQYFYFLFYIKWGFFIITFIAIFKRAPHLKLFLFGVIAVEFVLGLSSFFASSFATILMFSLIAYSAVSKKISWFKGLLFLVFGALLFHIAVLWTAAKGNYRTYVSQGETVQQVKVSQEDARAKLLELIVKVEPRAYQKAVEALVDRVGYIHYFATSIRFVPSQIPHENGKVYLEALMHYLVPRFINPDKPQLDDTKHTNKYTGLNLSGKSRGSSFSLGTYADAYIDFGPIFMFIPIFMFGYLIGYMFQYLYQPGIWGLIFTSPFFLLINIYGADTTKALGFLLIYFLVMYFLRRTLKDFINPFMLPILKI